MIARRDMLMGGACVVAAGAAYALKPRNSLILLSGSKMGDLLPLGFADWTSENADDLVRPTQDNSLAATLYTELVGRIYHQQSTGATVMMLIAYGNTQSDLLQLHRPESCYPAVGFTIASSVPTRLKLPGGARLPAREVVAKTQSRQENIIYWTRLGEFLPTSAGEQRAVRLRTALQGYIPDGALFRFSTLGDDSSKAFSIMREFIPTLLMNVPPTRRQALVGSELAKHIEI